MCCPGVASSAQGVVQALSGRSSSMAVASGGMVATETLRYGLDEKSGAGWRGAAGGTRLFRMRRAREWVRGRDRSAIGRWRSWRRRLGRGPRLCRLSATSARSRRHGAGFFFLGRRREGAGVEPAAGRGGRGLPSRPASNSGRSATAPPARQSRPPVRPPPGSREPPAGLPSCGARWAWSLPCSAIARRWPGGGASAAVGRFRLPPRGSGFQPLAAAQAASSASTNFWQLA